MKTKLLFLLASFFYIIGSLNAQEIIKLYPKEVPGLKEGISVTETNTSDRNDGIVRLRNVTEPTLTVYKPKGKVNSNTAVIICPGGGYYILAFNHEGSKIGEWFAARGITAFVLKYRLPQDDLFTMKEIRPLQDAQQAIRFVRSNSSKYQIKPDQIGIMGFSAGGHLAASASTMFEQQVGEITDDKISVRPDFSILMYPVISFNDQFGHSGSRSNLIGPDLDYRKIEQYSTELHVNKQTPPAFLVHAFDDPVKVENSLAYVSALKANGVPAELHLYEKGGHGFGLASSKETPVKDWSKRLEEWLKDHQWMK